jgi:hypothetical protein
VLEKSFFKWDSLFELRRKKEMNNGITLGRKFDNNVTIILEWYSHSYSHRKCEITLVKL